MQCLPLYSILLALGNPTVHYFRYTLTLISEIAEKSEGADIADITEFWPEMKKIQWYFLFFFHTDTVSEISCSVIAPKILLYLWVIGNSLKKHIKIGQLRLRQ